MFLHHNIADMQEFIQSIRFGSLDSQYKEPASVFEVGHPVQACE